MNSTATPIVLPFGFLWLWPALLRPILIEQTALASSFDEPDFDLTSTLFARYTMSVVDWALVSPIRRSQWIAYNFAQGKLSGLVSPGQSRVLLSGRDPYIHLSVEATVSCSKYIFVQYLAHHKAANHFHQVNESLPCDSFLDIPVLWFILYLLPDSGLYQLVASPLPLIKFLFRLVTWKIEMLLHLVRVYGLSSLLFFFLKPFLSWLSTLLSLPLLKFSFRILFRCWFLLSLYSCRQPGDSVLPSASSLCLYSSNSFFCVAPCNITTFYSAVMHLLVTVLRLPILRGPCSLFVTSWIFTRSVSRAEMPNSNVQTYATPPAMKILASWSPTLMSCFKHMARCFRGKTASKKPLLLMFSTSPYSRDRLSC